MRALSQAIFTSLSILAAPMCTFGDEGAQPKPVEGFEGFYRTAGVFMSAQPSEQDLRRLIHDFRLTRVVNLAHERFMERNVPFDERALLESIGVDYVHIPFAGGSSMNPDRIHAINDAIESAEGGVLLHSMELSEVVAHWAALQTLEHGLDPLAGYQMSRSLMSHDMGIPFEGYAGGRLVPKGLSDGARPHPVVHEPEALDTPLAAAPIGVAIDHGRPEGIRGFMVDGRFAIGGQPDEAALERLAGEGYTLIVNLRRQEEMDELQIDEPAVCERLGMTYVHIPSGWGDGDYTPEQLSQFAAALENQTGRVFLHCQVGWRAQHMWGAYLLRYRGFSVNDALWTAMSPDHSWPMSNYERLIGREFSYELAPTE